MTKQPAIYMIVNKPNGEIYTGVTSNLQRRISEHKIGAMKGFASRYGCKTLVYYEIYEDMNNAIAREKQIKGGSRQDKVNLIKNTNPLWEDLYNKL